MRSTVEFLFSLFFDWNKNTVIFFVVYIVCFIWVQKNSVPLFVFFSILNFILWHCNCSSLFSLYALLHARSFSLWNIYVYIYILSVPWLYFLIHGIRSRSVSFYIVLYKICSICTNICIYVLVLDMHIVNNNSDRTHDRSCIKFILFVAGWESCSSCCCLCLYYTL